MISIDTYHFGLIWKTSDDGDGGKTVMVAVEGRSSQVVGVGMNVVGVGSYRLWRVAVALDRIYTSHKVTLKGIRAFGPQIEDFGMSPRMLEVMADTAMAIEEMSLVHML